MLPDACGSALKSSRADHGMHHDMKACHIQCMILGLLSNTHKQVTQALWQMMSAQQ
jgi:hypothetical protein